MRVDQSGAVRIISNAENGPDFGSMSCEPMSLWVRMGSIRPSGVRVAL